MPKAKKVEKQVARAALPGATEVLRPFLRLSPASDDSDSTLLAKPLPLESLPLRPTLKKSSSRPPSKSRGRSHGPRGRSRSRASPQRAKPAEVLPSCLIDSRTTLSLARQDGPMPDDFASPTHKADFLERALTNVHRDWKVGARTYVPGKYLCAHPRSLAPPSTSADCALPERIPRKWGFVAIGLCLTCFCFAWGELGHLAFATHA